MAITSINPAEQVVDDTVCVECGDRLPEIDDMAMGPEFYGFCSLHCMEQHEWAAHYELDELLQPDEMLVEFEPIRFTG